VRALLDQVLDGGDLSESQAEGVLRALASGGVAPAVAGGMLAGLRAKGETAAELRGFARGMRDMATPPALGAGARRLVDTCGTGGDGSHSLNLSTGAALLAAACGAEVVKHGNRSVSSRSGSADVLESLGVPVSLPPSRAGEPLDAAGFTFLFAPLFHPAMKAIMPVRRAMGVRTVFNLLGPLTNPAKPRYQVIGAWSADAAGRIADAASGLPIERVFVVHGAHGWDEATPVGPYLLFDVRPGEVRRTVRDPAEAGIGRCAESALRGGEAEDNARRLRDALAGGDTVAHRDALALGAGLALEVCGIAATLEEGVALARAALEDGRGARVLERLAAVGRRLGGEGLG
jgi:anthranilate phosphoribosyltransferase